MILKPTENRCRLSVSLSLSIHLSLAVLEILGALIITAIPTSSGQQSVQDDGGVKVTLTSSSPAVVDSNITFRAQLDKKLNTTRLLYKYEWEDNADLLHFFTQRNKTISGDSCEISVRYDNNIIGGRPLGPSQMKVKVYRQTPGQDAWDSVLATAEVTFQLTETLNGNLDLSQPGIVRRKSNIFATHNRIDLHAIVTDKFTYAKYNYSWHVDNYTVKAETSGPNYFIKFEETGFKYVGVTVKGNVTVVKDQVKPKQGIFRQYIELKDVVSSLEFNGATHYKKGDQLNGSFTCTGSGPFSFCLEVFSPNMPSILSNTTCVHISSETDCYVPVTSLLDKAGVYTIIIQAANDVSTVFDNVPITVGSSAGPVVHSSVLVTIACILIGVVVFGTLTYTYYRERTTTAVEIADFDFYLYSARDTANSLVERLKDITSAILTRVQGLSEPRRRPSAMDSDYEVQEEQYTLLEQI